MLYSPMMGEMEKLKMLKLLPNNQASIQNSMLMKKPIPSHSHPRSNIKTWVYINHLCRPFYLLLPRKEPRTPLVRSRVFTL